MSAARSIAMIEPLGDYGIGSYVYELSEGLAAHGVRVDVSTYHGTEDVQRRLLTLRTKAFVFERNVNGRVRVQDEF